MNKNPHKTILVYLVKIVPFQKKIMRLTRLFAVAIIALLVSFKVKPSLDEHATLTIGTKAPDFKLPGVDGKIYTLASFAKAKVLAIVFTCNHCPTAQAYEDRIIKLTNDYKAKGVQVVAISPNDPNAVRLDELGWSDISDSFAEMKLRAKQKKFNFPYLYDGKTQSVAKLYGPVATPHVFIFDKERKLRYQGRIDDVEKPTKTPNNFDTRNALDEVLADMPGNVVGPEKFFKLAACRMMLSRARLSPHCRSTWTRVWAALKPLTFRLLVGSPSG